MIKVMIIISTGISSIVSNINYFQFQVLTVDFQRQTRHQNSKKAHPMKCLMHVRNLLFLQNVFQY
jgi:hypothetical protein